MKDDTTAKTTAIIGMTFPPPSLSKSPRDVHIGFQKYLDICVQFTQFSTHNTANYEERSQELKVGHISPQDELVKAGRHSSSEAAQDDPDGGRD